MLFEIELIGGRAFLKLLHESGQMCRLIFGIVHIKCCLGPRPSVKRFM